MITPGNNRRTRAVQLLASGREMLASTLPLWREVQQKITKQMGKKRLSYLIEEFRVLEKMASNY